MAKKTAKRSKTAKKPKSAKAKRARKSKPVSKAKPAGKVKLRKNQVAERDLEEGLEETFPGSDPVAATEPGPKE